MLNAVIFPHNIGLGCSRKSGVGRTRSTNHRHRREPPASTGPSRRASRFRVTNVGARTYEGFGETPELARTLGEAAVRGYQGNDLSDPLSVLACAKHWIADGGTNYGTGRKLKEDVQILDRGDVEPANSELSDIHMAGYVSAIKAGVGTIMPSYSSWNGVKCSGSKRLLTEILKEELKFDGFLISDYDAIDEMPGDYKTQIETSVNAGMDMFMVSAQVSRALQFCCWSW